MAARAAARKTGVGAADGEHREERALARSAPSGGTRRMFAGHGRARANDRSGFGTAARECSADARQRSAPGDEAVPPRPAHPLQF
jgi:hypothetical protein